jgi:hypothetical protein
MSVSVVDELYMRAQTDKELNIIKTTSRNNALT